MPAPGQPMYPAVLTAKDEVDTWKSLGDAVETVVLPFRKSQQPGLSTNVVRSMSMSMTSPLAPKRGELLGLLGVQEDPGRISGASIDAAMLKAHMMGLTLERWQVKALLIASAAA